MGNFASVRASAGLTLEEAQELLDVPAEVITQWDQGTLSPPVHVIQALRGLALCRASKKPSDQKRESVNITPSAPCVEPRRPRLKALPTTVGKTIPSTAQRNHGTTMQDRHHVLSVFSGAGGMSLGFRKAGLSPVIAAEIDTDACETYRRNVGDNIYNLDLSVSGNEFERAATSLPPPFAIIGGPPCQGFSSAGNKKEDDHRNALVFRYLWLVSRLQPRWFFFENVEGILTSGDGERILSLVRELIGVGYSVRLEKVNLASYGLPQCRKRVLLIGNRNGIEFQLPPATHSYDAGKHKARIALPLAPSVDDALAGLSRPRMHEAERVEYSTASPMTGYDAKMRSDRGYVTHHFSKVSGDLEHLFSLLAPGETMKDLPEKHWHRSYARRAYRRVRDGTPTEKRGGAPSGVKRLRGDLNSLTITSAATREFIHPYEHRPLTLREAARLQSFPDDFDFTGTTASVARQIGNAVPPLAAEVLARHLLYVDGSFGSDRQPAEGELLGFRLTDADGMSPALARTQAALEALQCPQSPLFGNRWQQHHGCAAT